MNKKVGDTLIEVTLAIGIFSMVAITVASVINGSTSSAQVSLEKTVAREEIDAQAEALRYIHNSYIAGGLVNEEGEDKYKELWQEITNPLRLLADGSSELAEALTYNPATCAELYEGEKLKNQGAFVIDTNKLYLLNPSSNVAFEDAWPQILITPETSGVTFSAPSTYPRLIHANATENESILDQDKNVDTESLSRVEGLYIVPIKDQGDTVIIQGTTGQKKSAYYDFYIRSCWYGPGADHPSTISTVIRLYDPNIIDYSTP